MSGAWRKKTWWHALLAKGNLMNFNFLGGKELSCSVPMIFIGGIDHVVNYEMPLNAEVGTMLGSFIECKGGVYDNGKEMFVDLSQFFLTALKLIG